MGERKSINKLIEEQGLKKIFIAQKLSIRPETLSRKIRQPETFNANEMALLSEILKTGIDEIDFGVVFFAQKLELNSSVVCKQTA